MLEEHHQHILFYGIARVTVANETELQPVVGGEVSNQTSQFAICRSDMVEMEQIEWY